MKKIVIDGYALCKTHSGVQRYMKEILKEIDNILSNTAANFSIEIVYPENEKLKNPGVYFNKIKLVGIHVNSKYLEKKWKYHIVHQYAKKEKGILCNMANGFMTRADVLCIHDCFLAYADGYSLLRKVFFRLRLMFGCFFAKRIITVSQTSKNDIKKYGRFSRPIHVIYNGWQHMKDIYEDDSIFEKHNRMVKGKYFYSIGNIVPTKNLEWIINVARENPNRVFVIAGNVNRKKEWISKLDAIHNIIYLGRVSDEENKALMKNCMMFLFPSKYEGFGIPPLEAISVGGVVAVSNASCLPEIYGDYVHYFEPNDYYVDLISLYNENILPSEELLNKYSWRESAKQWLDVFAKMIS